MGKYESKKVFNFLGFLVTILIAVAILITGIYLWINNGRFTLQIPGFGFGSVQAAIMCIANMLAYFMCMIVGFNYARSKRSPVFVIIDIIAIVFIVVVVVLCLFGVWNEN